MGSDKWTVEPAVRAVARTGLSDGDGVIDVGCGTGSLIFVLPEIAKIEAAIGVDLAKAYVEAVRACNTNQRITLQEADARERPSGCANRLRRVDMSSASFVTLTVHSD